MSIQWRDCASEGELFVVDVDVNMYVVPPMEIFAEGVNC